MTAAKVNTCKMKGGFIMLTPKQLDQFLFQETFSEVWHINHPNELSSKYNHIQTTMVRNKPVYVFQFDSIIRNGKFAIQKESRFTGVPAHRHVTIEMNYVYAGEAHYIVDGHEVVLRKGDVCILDTNVIHRLLPVGADDIILNIELMPTYFTTGFMTQLADRGVVTSFLLDAISQQQSQESYLLFRPEEMPALQDAMCVLLSEYFDQQLGSEHILSAEMIIIFTLLIRVYQNAPHDEDDVVGRTDILPILEYIETHYKEITLLDLSKQFGYHPNYISTLLKRYMGKSFRELKLNVQMQQAELLVKNTQMPIYEIATELGFSNLGQFYKHFEKYTHKTPKIYRQVHQENI